MCYKDTERDINLYYDEQKLLWFIEQAGEIVAQGESAILCLSNFRKLKQEENQ